MAQCNQYEVDMIIHVTFTNMQAANPDDAKAFAEEDIKSQFVAPQFKLEKNKAIRSKLVAENTGSGC